MLLRLTWIGLVGLALGLTPAGLAAVQPCDSGPAPGAPKADLAGAVRDLAAADGATRFAAERWLAAHLGGADGSELLAAVEAAGELDEETVWRLGRALGASQEHLGLALDLAVGRLGPQAEPELELEPLFSDEPPSSADRSIGPRLGGLALDQLISGWLPGLERQPTSGAALQLLLRELREREPWIPLRLRDGTTSEVFGLLAREGNLPVPIVMSPDLAERITRENFTSRSEAPTGLLEGPWDHVLRDFAKSHGLAWEAVLFSGEVADEVAWLRLVRRGEEGVESGAAQLRRSLEDLARGRSSVAPGARRGPGSTDALDDPGSPLGRLSQPGALQLAARFLAGVGWSASLDWLGDRWSEERDLRALVALLEAAARGRFEARLITTPGLERLLATADQMATSGRAGERHLERLELAFARLPRLGPDGSLAPILLAGARDADAAVLRLRLIGLEAVGGGGPAGAALARAVLQDSRGPEILWPALGVLGLADPLGGQAAAAGDPPALAAPAALLGLVPDRVAADELARRLVLAGVALPDALVRSGARRPAQLRVVVIGAILAGDHELAAELLVDELEFDRPGSWSRSLEGGRSLDELAEGFRALVARGELLAVRAVLEAARERGRRRPVDPAMPVDLTVAAQAQEPVGLDRIELLAGAMGAERQALLVAHLETGAEASPLFFDLEALGFLAAAPSGASVRRLLLAKLNDALSSPRAGEGAETLPAIEAGLHQLWARSADQQADDWILAVAEVAAGAASHPLARKILLQSWPAAPARVVRDLDRRGPLR